MITFPMEVLFLLGKLIFLYMFRTSNMMWHSVSSSDHSVPQYLWKVEGELSCLSLLTSVFSGSSLLNNQWLIKFRIDMILLLRLQDIIEKYTDISRCGKDYAALAIALGVLTWEKPSHPEFQQLARYWSLFPRFNLYSSCASWWIKLNSNISMDCSLLVSFRVRN